MFKVKSKRSGNVYTVYAVSGKSFFIFFPDDGYRTSGSWHWVDCDKYIPLEESDG